MARIDRMRTIWVFGIITAFFWGHAGFATPLPPPAKPALELHCDGLLRAKPLCLALRTKFSRSDAFAESLHWAASDHIRQQSDIARRSARAAGVDRGFLDVLSGNFGEGLHNLLAEYAKNPRQPTQNDLIFAAIMVASVDLDDVQRRDWAKDLAGRLSQPWKNISTSPENGAWQPRAVDVYRVSYLYRMAEEPDAAAFFAAWARKIVPNANY